MKKLLFLSSSYAIEGIQHGSSGLNGATAMDEMIVAALAEFAEVIVVTDRPERYPGRRTTNIFRKKIVRAKNFEDFWRHEFRVLDGTSNSDFSRDTLYRLFQLANAIDPKRLDEVLTNEIFDIVVLNRHENFFFARHPALRKCNLVYFAHDSNYNRKVSFEVSFGERQPLTHIEKSIEFAFAMEAKKIVSISTSEQIYFNNLVDGCEVILFRPIIEFPTRMVNVYIDQPIDYYFVGVKNFCNRQSLFLAIDLFLKCQRSPFDKFHVFGSVSQNLLDDHLHQSIVVHGHVDDIKLAIADMDVLLAPIEAGSGIPIKIAEALSAGHLVLASDFGAASYPEFIGSRVIIIDELKGSVVEALCAAPASFLPYEEYARKNRLAAKQVVGSQ